MTENAAIPRWHVVGDWFDACKCDVPCPCTFAQAPTHGDCDGVLAWHIREGRYGDVSLDGLNVLMIGSFTGNVWEGKHSEPYAAIFMDERADEAQREALERVFGGQAGGWPAEFVRMFNPEMKGLEYAPVAVSVDDDLGSWSTEVPGRVEARGEALGGPTTRAGERAQSTGLPGSETGPGQVVTWGRALSYRAQAFGFDLNRQNTSSKHITFDWSGPD
ncbi:DUF1326 domain-containing protein [Spirillospora sp. NPDC052242]